MYLTLCYTLCSEKNTHSVSFISPWLMRIDLNKNCSEYTYGTADTNLLTMQKLDILCGGCGRWRSYDVTFFWLKLERVYSKRYAGSPGFLFFFEYLLVHRRGRIVYYLVEFKTTNKTTFRSQTRLSLEWVSILFANRIPVSITFFHLLATLPSFPDCVLPHLSLVQSHELKSSNHF